MGRTNGSSCIPQRSKLTANKEQRRQIRQNIFGPHRLVEPESAQALREVMIEMQADGEIPDHITITRFFRVTLVERGKMRRSMERGIIGGYHLFSTIAEIENRTAQTRTEPLPVELGKVSLMDRRDQTIVVGVENETLRREQEAIVDTLEDGGLTGIREMRRFRPQISLGTGTKPFTVFEKKHIERVLDEVMPAMLPEAVMLGEFQMGLPRDEE